MYKRMIVLAFVLIGLTVVLSVLPIHGESEVYDSVLRLHVLANSDSEEDQALKIKVRDAVLGYTSEGLGAVTSRDKAEAFVKSELDAIRDVAQQTVYDCGYDYSVSVELGEEKYPTRNYEACAFPAGEYLSLRINIGESSGQNWWCVLYPPLCLSAVSADTSDGAVDVGLSGEQFNIITQTDSPKYKIRFKLLEIFG